MAVTRLRTTLDALERALNGLAGAKGRKSVILVSEGFIHDINVDEFKRVSEASRRANAAVYFLNSRGLEGMPIEMTAQFGPALPDQDVGFAFSESWDAVAGRTWWPTTAADSRSATRTTSRAASRRSRTRPRPTTCSATSLEHRARRQVPEDPGEAREREGPPGAGSQGLLRAGRHGEERLRPEEGRRPGGSRAPSTRRGPKDAIRCG